MSFYNRPSDYMFGRRSDTEGGNTIDMALQAGALFKVHTAPVHVMTQYGDEVEYITEGKYKGLPRHQVYYRTTNDEADGPLKTVLNIAHPSHPNSNYLQFLETVEGLFPESCTDVVSLDEGKRLACRWSLGDPVDLGDGDVIHPHLLGIASLNSTWTSSLVTFVKRVFCTNQQRTGENVISVRRTTNHDRILNLKALVLAEKANALERYVDTASTLKRLTIDNTDFRRMFDVICPEPEPNDKGEISTRSQNIYDKKWEGAWYYWQEEQDGPAGKTAWGAWNAIQSLEFHNIANNVNKKVEVVRGTQPMSNMAQRHLLQMADF